MSQAWECPRCGRMNAPFNPTCFCDPNDGDYQNSAKTPPPPQSSEHVMDSFNYLMGGEPIPATKESGEEFLKRKYEAAKKLAEWVNKLDRTKVYLPQFPCSICGAKHWAGFDCATLTQNTLPPNGEFI